MRIIVVSTNAGRSKGGEAIKAWQYFSYLLAQGYDACLLTHSRCRDELLEHFDASRLIFVEDDLAQRFLWRSRVFRRFLTPYFHRAAARLCRQYDQEQTLIHYLCPISPAEPRLPPKGYRYVIGPVSGNVFYPPAFRSRAGKVSRLQEVIYRPMQSLSALVSSDKKRAMRVLVSGYARTHTALRWADVDESKMIDVVDSGVDQHIVDAPRVTHVGRNGNFVWIARVIDLKGADLAIAALARTDTDIRLTLYGEGPAKGAAVALAERLGVRDRVDFAGWLPHEDYVTKMVQFRGFVFPTLAESNGIVMQEAMTVGLPVITLRWGGPIGLADDSEALFIDPESEDTVIAGIADAMTRLAGNPQLAEKISSAARKKARQEFVWERVAQTWTAAYPPEAHPQKDRSA